MITVTINLACAALGILGMIISTDTLALVANAFACGLNLGMAFCSYLFECRLSRDSRKPIFPT